MDSSNSVTGQQAGPAAPRATTAERHGTLAASAARAEPPLRPYGRREAFRRSGESLRVRQLATKVEAAEKSERLGDWRASFIAQSSCEFEFRPVAQDHPRSFTTGVGG